MTQCRLIIAANLDLDNGTGVKCYVLISQGIGRIFRQIVALGTLGGPERASLSWCKSQAEPSGALWLATLTRFATTRLVTVPSVRSSRLMLRKRLLSAWTWRMHRNGWQGELTTIMDRINTVSVNVFEPLESCQRWLPLLVAPCL